MTEVYQIGVKLLMTSNHAQVLSTLSKSLLGINAQANQLTGTFNKLKVAIGGALAIYAGTKAIGYLESMVMAGGKIVHQQQLMAIAGLSNRDIADATAKAYQTSARIQTTTIAENLKHIRELRYAFGDMKDAQAALEQVSKINAVIQGVTGRDTGDQVWAMVKSLEQIGVTQKPAEFKQYLDNMQRVLIATGGKVTPAQYLNTIQYGRTAALGWDEDFITGALARSIQSMGGNSGTRGPGNALMSAYAAVVQGSMSKFSSNEFSKLGLGTRDDIKDAGLFQKNPYEWTQRVLVPALEAHGYTNKETILQEVGKLLENRTASYVIGEYATQGRAFMGDKSQFEKDIRQQHQAWAGAPSYAQLLSGDLTMNMKAFHQQWDALMESLGSALVPAATSMLRRVTDAISEMTKFSQVHPEIISEIAAGIGILGAALIGIGAVAIIGAIGAGGWFVGGVIALGAAFAMFHTQIADAVKAIPPGVIAIASALTLGLAAALLNLGKVANYDWKGTFGHLIDGLQSFWDKLKSFLSGAGSGIAPPGNGDFLDPKGGFKHMSYVVPDTSGAGLGGLHSGGGYTINGSAGSGTGAYVGGNGQGGWWTPAREGFAVNYLMRNAGLPELSARALVARWAGVESTARGPWSLNYKGAIGIEQALGTRKRGIVLGDFVGQLHHAVGELLQPSGQNHRAYMMLMHPHGALGAAIGASQFERAEGYNLHSGADNWVGKTLHTLPHIPGESQADSPFIPPAQHKEINVHHTTLLDGRVVAQNTLKHIVGMGNRPSQGARLSDYSGTRPQSV